MSRRRAATLVETLLGAALFLAVMAGAWVVLTATRRQTEQAYRYTSVTQGAASIATRLRLDLAAVTLGGPPGPGNAAVQVGEDGRSLGLLRAPALGPTGGPMEVPSGSVWVEWSTAPGPGGTSLLVRTENAAALDPADRMRMTWELNPARLVRFRRELHAGHHYVIAELLMVDLVAAEDPGATPRRGLPIRVVAELRDPGSLGAIEAYLPEFDLHELLGPLPAEEPLDGPIGGFGAVVE